MEIHPLIYCLCLFFFCTGSLSWLSSGKANLHQCKWKMARITVSTPANKVCRASCSCAKVSFVYNKCSNLKRQITTCEVTQCKPVLSFLHQLENQDSLSFWQVKTNPSIKVQPQYWCPVLQILKNKKKNELQLLIIFTTKTKLLPPSWIVNKSHSPLSVWT